MKRLYLIRKKVVVLTRHTHTMEFTLYLSGNDSWSFTVPQLDRLKGEWECAITEIAMTPGYSPRRKRLYLCSDLVGETLVNDRKLSILRNIDAGKKYKATEFVNLHYVKLRGTAPMFRIYFYDEKLNPVEPKPDDFYCVLRFRRSQK